MKRTIFYSFHTNQSLTVKCHLIQVKRKPFFYFFHMDQIHIVKLILQFWESKLESFSTVRPSYIWKDLLFSQNQVWSNGSMTPWKNDTLLPHNLAVYYELQSCPQLITNHLTYWTLLLISIRSLPFHFAPKLIFLFLSSFFLLSMAILFFFYFPIHTRQSWNPFLLEYPRLMACQNSPRHFQATL